MLLADSMESKETRLQTVAYQRAVEDNANEKKGPPNQFAFAGLLQALKSRGDGLGQ